MADEKSPKTGGIADSYRQAQPYVDAVWQFAGCMGLCILAGYWLDKKWHTTPWLLVVGSLVGFAAGMWVLFRTVLGLSAKDKAQHAAGPDGPPDTRKQR